MTPSAGSKALSCSEDEHIDFTMLSKTGMRCDCDLRDAACSTFLRTQYVVFEDFIPPLQRLWKAVPRVYIVLVLVVVVPGAFDSFYVNAHSACALWSQVMSHRYNVPMTTHV